MAGGTATVPAANFEETSALRLSLIVVFFVVISYVFEKSLHALHHYFKHHNKEGMNHVVTMLKDEILLVGFLSLVLLTLESNLLSITLPEAKRWEGVAVYNNICGGSNPFCGDTYVHGDNPLGCSSLPMDPSQYDTGRRLGGSADVPPDAFVSPTALHQTHILIFLMAVVHISYCSLTMFLTEWRAKSWMKYERMVLSQEATSRTLVKLQMQVPRVYDKKWKQTLSDILGHLTTSVNGLTYVALRNWFIAKHRLSYQYYFHEYLLRCTHRDFTYTMGVRWWMWLQLIINILTDGYDMFNVVVPMASVVLAIAVGTKLFSISNKLTRRSFDLHDYNNDQVLDEAELVAMQTVTDDRIGDLAQLHVNDNLFWFGKPHVMLWCIQAVMFQNALEIAMTLFFRWQIGSTACALRGNGYFVMVRMILSLVLLVQQALFSLPVYSLVVQMGSRFNRALLKDSVRKQLRHLAIRHRQSERLTPASVLHKATGGILGSSGGDSKRVAPSPHSNSPSSPATTTTGGGTTARTTPGTVNTSAPTPKPVRLGPVTPSGSTGRGRMTPQQRRAAGQEAARDMQARWEQYLEHAPLGRDDMGNRLPDDHFQSYKWGYQDHYNTTELDAAEYEKYAIGGYDDAGGYYDEAGGYYAADGSYYPPQTEADQAEAAAAVSASGFVIDADGRSTLRTTGSSAAWGAERKDEVQGEGEGEGAGVGLPGQTGGSDNAVSAMASDINGSAGHAEFGVLPPQKKWDPTQDEGTPKQGRPGVVLPGITNE